MSFWGGTSRGEMTDQQEQHLEHIQEAFERAADGKYRAGVREHGGNLWEMTPRELVLNALAEAVDQVTYLVTLLDKM